ncbi:MAG: response regulator [Chitinispirillia bacterium]|nr:response regulator [Chitinispirillia bacterium]MCL2242060.1 response regulator [Chitinispirillia bacterium]
MSLTREQLLSIGNLKLSGWLDGLDDRLLGQYCDTLSDFVEDFPGIEADLKKALFIGDVPRIAYVLSELSEVLANIHAEDLVRECERLRQPAGAAGPSAAEAELTAFLSTVATLSVDIQMEQHKSGGPRKPDTRGFQAAGAEGMGAPVPADEQQKSILAVDDIAVTLTQLRMALTAAGYKFNGVTSGASALDYITKFKPDLFILDIEMPKMNGFELAEKLKGAGQTAPIVFLTGNTTRDYLMRAVKIGAVDFIVKPVNANTVAGKVGKIFAKKPV